MATEAAFSEDTLRNTLGHLEAVQTHMQLPPGAIDSFKAIVSECVSIRAQKASEAEKATSGQSADSLRFLGDELGDDELNERYREALKDKSFGSFDRTAKGAYMYELAKRAASVSGTSRQRQKRIAKELRSMQSPGGLPLHAAASIFVRTDEERSDVLRAAVVGPEGTPYASGLFFFDILFPQDYPNDAPLMLLETTGGGRVRFNPNLYADGKILVSVQSMVFVDDPYFNEPNVDSMRYQAEGIAASQKRNASLRLDTVRWAILDVLRNSRPGFEEATRAHFRVLRGRIMQQCCVWLEEAAVLGELHQQQMLLAMKELHQELEAL